MTKAPLDYIQTLNSLFEEAIQDAYRMSDAKKRTGILPYLQAIYRRWYYSALIEESFLTPANILEAICRSHNESPNTYPVAHRRSKAKFTGVKFELIEYSLDNHPIVADLGLVIDYCSPYVDLHDGEMFTPPQAMELATMLSLNDPHYAAFLLEIALRMKLLAKVPSVGVNRYKPSPSATNKVNRANKADKADKMEATHPREMFQDIVEATINIGAKALQGLTMLPETLFTPTFIRSLLTSPMETDEIFSRMYDVLGYDLEDLVDIVSATQEEEEPDDTDIDLMLGTFMAGVMLDKFFFTPFGHFMKLIRPAYVLPFELEGEISDYVAVSSDPEESVIAFFAPCSSYTLTDMGLEFFDVQKNKDNYIDVTEVVPFEHMKATVFSSKEALTLFAAVAKHLGPLRSQEAMPPEDVFTFRVRLASDTTVWAHLQMPTDATLHETYQEITDFLDLKENDDYSFFHDKTENRFAEYTSQKRTKRGGKKTSDSPLDSLDFERQKHMLLVAYNQAVPFGGDDPIVHVQLEMLSKNPADPKEDYPRVSRVSKGLREITEW